MKKIIHINQHNIRHNIKNPNSTKPVITCKDYKTNTTCNDLTVKDKQGTVLFKVVYSPDKPLNCGAKVWIELDDKNLEVITE